MSVVRGSEADDRIAIVGMAGRFPGAASVAEFWENLKAGRESLSQLSDEELLASGIDAARLADPLYVKARGILEDVDLFDASFFGFTPKEAELTDPQHRLFLETCSRALEDAGCNPETFGGGIGVFGGMSMNTYLLAARGRDAAFWKDLTEAYQIGEYASVLGNDCNFLTTRVSYKLDLKGPSLDVQTGCSTSLVAVSLACRALLQHDCDAALAGGVSITFPQKRGYLYQEGAMGSPDGKCRAFDAAAAGTVFGAGVAIVVLKRLSDALAQGDSIVAVIRGFAVNNDGASKVGYTAPSVEGQAEVVATAQAAADVDAETIGYVETHGTGTPLGDPIEIAGLTRAFRSATEATQFCAIGSVKPNVGHLDNAAGVTGLIKAALAVRTGLIPPSLHYTRPNPAIDFANSPFYVNTRLSEWRPPSGPRRAGVSALGVGGTNVHVILEEAPASTPPSARSSELLVLSAKTPSALDAAAENLARHLAEHPDAPLANLAFTLQSGRRRFGHRRALVCADAAHAISSLRRPRVPGRETPAALSASPVSFLFPGQGSQWPGMAREISETEPRFRAEVERCCDLLGAEGKPLLDLLLAVPGEGEAPEKSPIHRTAMAQPGIFIVEYALARLWESWGVRPAEMLGHSLGEFVAATLAGVFALPDALALVAARGRLIDALPGGSMLAVRMDEAQLATIARPGLSLAAVNAPSLCVLSGRTEVIEGVEAELAELGIVHRRLQTSHAFHSEMMDSVIAPFESLVRKVRLTPPSIPIVSSVTGQWISAAEATDPAYWSAHLRKPVRFAGAVATLLSAPERTLIEVGPGQTLSLHAKRHPARTERHLVVSSLSHADDRESDRSCLLRAVGQLWESGISIDWPTFQAGRGLSHVSLPTYPFERNRYWIGPRSVSVASAAAQNAVAVTQAPLAPAQLPAAPDTRTQEVRTMNEPPVSAISRHPLLVARIQRVIGELSGIPPAEISPAATFLELGFDSLFLTQASQHLQKEFGIRVAFRDLLGDASTPDALASRFDAELPAEVAPPPSANASPSPATVAAVTSALPIPGASPAAAGATVLERVMGEQLRVMSEQLAMLRGEAPSTPAPAVSSPAVVAAPAPTTPAQATPPTGEKSGFKPFGPYKPIDKASSGALSTAQRQYLSGFIDRYTRKTVKSKRLAEEHRSHFADPRVVAGFRLDWKEMVYPIVATGSSGSRIRDVDGNEYVDMLMGFGLNLFGHSPKFVTDAVIEQLQKGVEIGPQSPLAGEVARLISGFTGMERVTFCNTGSEAVMTAMRLARTVTGRDTVALFAGAYHGTFDEVLVRGVRSGAGYKSFPIAPGIPSSHVEDVLVLPYGTDESLEILKARMGDLAAVVVEPVQSRHPDLQPVEFLRELRRLTEKAGTALIFDEVITGFRVHPGGTQALFGIQADIATYGKVLGGGHPLGVVAGKRTYMDALDGGAWRFGDDSVPEIGVTFFAGTFVRHPLAMAAALAVLNRLKEAGPAFQEGLNAKAAPLAARINRCFEKYGVPSRVENFGSILFFGFPSDQRLASLLFYHLREKGVHIWEGFPFFVTEAHTEKDLDFVVRAFEESAAEMRTGGLLPPMREESQSREPAIAPATAGPAAGQASAPAPFPLTDSQREIWLACQMGPDASCAFNEGVSLRLRGPLDVPALARSLEDLVARHDALRTTFDAAGDLQRVADGAPIPLPVSDLTAEAPAEPEMQRILANEAKTPFDLVRGPLIRARLVRLAAEDHVLVLTAHHLAADGWSINVLLGELASLYGARRDGTAPALEPAARFSDYAAREHARRTGADAAATDAFWLAKFASVPPPLDLPTDRPRPALKSYAGATVRRMIPSALAKDVQRAGAKEGSTLFATLFAAFAALLHRLTGQDDLVIGIPAAGQSLEDSENVVGHCVNFLSIRSCTGRGGSVREHLRASKREVLEAYDHRDSTYGHLIQKLALPRDPSRLPLVEAQFNLERIGSGLHWEGLGADVDANPKAFVNDDVFLNVVETANGLVLDCDFNTDLFDAETVERWLGYFERILEGIVQDAARPLAALPLWSDDERDRVLVEWNQTAGPPSPVGCAHQLFEAQAARTPASIAVSFRDQRLSYAELNSRSNQLARYLERQGAGPGVLVGLCLDRSLDLPVALLAVLKSGGAYLPLDPAHPRERNARILEDSGAALLLVNEGVSAPEGPRVLDLVAGRVAISREAEDNLAGRTTAEDLAYVIYTSGSTGQPKGVAVPHGALVNLLEAMRERPGLEKTDTLLAVTTVSFDIATLELLLPLTVGARTALAGREDAADGSRLMEELFRSQATVLQATPTTWRILVESGWRGQPNLKMLCGGEPLSRDLADALLSRGGSLWNVYGPTETTIWSAAGRVGAGEGAPPIGPPIANTQLYVLDDDLRPLPIGVRGEVFIGGAGVARGYWKRPDLTERNFLPDPFRPQGAGRLYRTGDVGRFRRDGRIELLGRRDRQVKLRGHRIELGEVEGALASHPAVSEAAALVREDAPGERRLVGYVVPKKDGSGTSSIEFQQQAEMRTQWEEQYKSALREHGAQQSPNADPSVNLYEWTGLGKVDEELDAWLAPVSEEILSWRPRRVLEIGCGTGLLLSRVAPHCAQYTGTDLSREALQSVRDRLTSPESGADRVALLCRMADDFSGVEAGSFDTVVINSVVEYLPSVESLLRVLEGAIRSVGTGGRVFVGDVPSLPMWDVFHAAVQLGGAPDSLSVGLLRERVRHAVSQGSRLLVDPDLFRWLKTQFAEIDRVEIRLSRGLFASEASRLHADTYYDVVLHLKGAQTPASPVTRSWEDESRTLPALEKLLSSRVESVLLRQVPISRLVSEVSTLELLAAADDEETVGDLRRKLQGVEGVDLAPLQGLADRFDYILDRTWSGSGRDGRFDLLFRRRDVPTAPGLSRDLENAKPLREYANSPAQSALARRLVPEIRALIQKTLPASMVPAVIEILDALPLTGNGKVDYRALPAPRGLHLLADEAFVAPRTAEEKTLASIWADVLRLDRVGVRDDVFELGGDSLMIFQITTRANQAGFALTPRHLFQYRTIQDLIQALAKEKSGSAAHAPIPLVSVPRDAHRVSRASVSRKEEDAGKPA